MSAHKGFTIEVVIPGGEHFPSARGGHRCFYGAEDGERLLRMRLFDEVVPERLAVIITRGLSEQVKGVWLSRSFRWLAGKRDCCGLIDTTHRTPMLERPAHGLPLGRKLRKRQKDYSLRSVCNIEQHGQRELHVRVCDVLNQGFSFGCALNEHARGIYCVERLAQERG